MELTERIGRKTGGVSVSSFTSDIKGQSEPAAFLMLRGKAVADKSSDLLELFTDILHSARLDDQARFKQVRVQHVTDVMHHYCCPPRLTWRTDSAIQRAEKAECQFTLTC